MVVLENIATKWSDRRGGRGGVHVGNKRLTVLEARGGMKKCWKKYGNLPGNFFRGSSEHHWSHNQKRL